MQKIALTNDVWQFDSSRQLGPEGGFGQVFYGEGPSGPVAIKRLKKAPRGLDERELKNAAKLTQLSPMHVVPVLDFGIDADSDEAFVVMPICDESLQGFIDREGPQNPMDALKILSECVAGLKEANGFVHRDMKPGNILRHKNAWKIADFGISKAVGDATSVETLRNALSPPYASPEQWNMETPTQKSDIYSLGGVFHFILTGKPPFVGSRDQMRNGHLFHDFSAVNSAPSQIRNLIDLTTRKAPATRPSLGRLQSIIENAQRQTETARPSVLADINADVSRKVAETQTQQRREQQVLNERREIGETAMEAMISIKAELFKRIKNDASNAQQLTSDQISLAHGMLTFRSPTIIWKEVQGWEIAAQCEYTVACDRPGASGYALQAGGHGVGSSLFFGRPTAEDDFRWYEVSFWEAFSRTRKTVDPHSLSVSSRDFEVAFSNTMGSYQFALRPTLIDDEKSEAFYNSIIDMFARAANGQFQRSNQMPPLPGYFGR